MEIVWSSFAAPSLVLITNVKLVLGHHTNHRTKCINKWWICVQLSTHTRTSNVMNVVLLNVFVHDFRASSTLLQMRQTVEIVSAVQFQSPSFYWFILFNFVFDCGNASVARMWTMHSIKCASCTSHIHISYFYLRFDFNTVFDSILFSHMWANDTQCILDIPVHFSHSPTSNPMIMI